MKDWMLKNLENIGLPFNEYLRRVVRLYAENAVQNPDIIHPLSEDEVKYLLRKDGEEITASKVFAVYYALLFNDMVFAANSKDEKKGVIAKEYSNEVMDLLPINKVLLFVEEKKNRDHFRSIFPTLSSLVAAQYPEFLHVGSFLRWENYQNEYVHLVFRFYLMLSSRDQEVLPSFRYDAWREERQKKRKFAIPQSYLKLTENLMVAYISESLRDDASFLLCLKFLYSLPMEEIFKHFRSITSYIIPALPDKIHSDEILDLAVKIFYSAKLIIRESCQFIHQRFISMTKYIKLVHFQGYDKNLLPVTVEEIPSMRNYLFSLFIPELLLQPQIEKQVFGTFLAAYLVEKYPLPISLNIIKDHVIPKLHGLLRGGVTPPVKQELIVEAAPHIGMGFPSLITMLLQVFEDISKFDPSLVPYLDQAAIKLNAYAKDPLVLNKSIK
ncbi:Integrator complex subunit 2 [Phlyctochytrium bullatum]|nr:Integrator complex subunit 2 [Phlyctochytrium bullatum]